MTKPADKPECPCQSGLLFQHCCQPFLQSTPAQLPETAEQLMRSRYTAYSLKNTDYLLKTWHPETRPQSLRLEQDNNHWIGLKIKSTHLGGKNDAQGSVHFIARYKINGKAYKLEENSQFEKLNGQWFYLHGDIAT